MKTHGFTLLLFLMISFLKVSRASAQKTNYAPAISAAADKIESKVIAWRHDIHEHPELGNREVRTAALIAKHLKSLVIEVKTGIGITGVVGILNGSKKAVEMVHSIRAVLKKQYFQRSKNINNSLLENCIEKTSLNATSVFLVPIRSARTTRFSISRSHKI